jgi:NADH-quinone oxidoreductase subunit E
MSFSLSENTAKRIDEIIRRYPKKDATLLPVLQIIQREQGLISPEAVDWISVKLGIPSVQIREVLSFYAMLRRKPAGRYVIQVCRNISCFLTGGEDVLRHLETRLGIKEGETTPDGKFTLLVVECLGNCDHAPCLMINDDEYGPVTPDLIDSLLKEIG